MNTPIVDFVRQYAESDVLRLHMPGHKGKSFLGFERYDITEIKGADALYEADGIIAQSEENARGLFGSAKTLYSTEGSSQCIRAMLALLKMTRSNNGRCVVLAARNVHKAFVYAAALSRIDVEWLYPDSTDSLCRCEITPAALKAALGAMSAPPAAVYITSPDYLGGVADIRALADVCHSFGVLLIVDNAHGAYLHFLNKPSHPLDLGADMCCDSAHKTMPVLTGGAYLHISENAPHKLSENAKAAMSMFGSTSPSYLTLCSLDMANSYIENGYREKLVNTINHIGSAKHTLCQKGWRIEESDPLKITVKAPCKTTGITLADTLRKNGIECEYADNDFVVLMATPENVKTDFDKLIAALGDCTCDYGKESAISIPKLKPAMPIYEAMFAPQHTCDIENAVGSICGAPTVSCPPAIPIAVSGEEITPEAIAIAKSYGIRSISVLK